LVFSEPVNVVEGSLSLNSGPPIATDRQVGADGRIQILIPQQNLEAFTDYVIRWGAGVTDLSGQDVLAGSASFTTGDEIAGPIIESLNGADGFAGSELILNGQSLRLPGETVQVLIAGVPAEILEWSPESIRVRVPTAAVGLSGPVSLISGRGVAVSPEAFTVESAPSLSSLEPKVEPIKGA